MYIEKIRHSFGVKQNHLMKHIVEGPTTLMVRARPFKKRYASTTKHIPV